MMDKKAIAKAYIQHLARGDLDALLQLFAEGAIVISPVYGQMPYTNFYTTLFADTNNSTLTVKGIYEDALTGFVALHFNYQWTLKNDTKVKFDVVDIIAFDAENRITKLTIIYDTVESRKLVGQLR
ncbi:MAG: nuclear transport factor 2 family protein [Bacteroidota bacterium]